MFGEILFQYISCCSLSVRKRHHHFLLSRFNTSHVVVYLAPTSSIAKSILRFNTSHVVVYLLALKISWHSSTSFNTSHVVVYPKIKVRNKNENFEFQYISCCSLSYQQCLHNCKILLFQYISCCSLSDSRTKTYNPYFTFQYISCCSLSLYSGTPGSGKSRFNTSHVVVYRNNSRLIFQSIWFQYISCCSLSQSLLL